MFPNDFSKRICMQLPCRLDVGHDQFIYYLHLKLRLKAKNDWLVYFRFNSTVTFKQKQ